MSASRTGRRNITLMCGTTTQGRTVCQKLAHYLLLVQKSRKTHHRDGGQSTSLTRRDDDVDGGGDRGRRADLARVEMKARVLDLARAGTENAAIAAADRGGLPLTAAQPRSCQHDQGHPLTPQDPAGTLSSPPPRRLADRVLTHPAARHDPWAVWAQTTRPPIRAARFLLVKSINR